VTISEEEVDILDLYASYSASAPCNVHKQVGAPVTCAQNCDRAVGDQPIILGTYS
jgi:hypothetical protein